MNWKQLGLMIMVASGVLHAKNYYGAEILSNEQVKYGRWEIRMHMAKLSGVISSFFTYENDSWQGAGRPWREIDIEYLGKSPNRFQSNIITGTAEERTTSAKSHKLPVDPGSSFNTFALEWTPDSVRWILNDSVIRVTRSSASDQVDSLRDLPQSYRMNLWATNLTGWAGTFDSANLPVYQVIRYMKYARYTPGAGPGGVDFTPEWTDSFSVLNTDRWTLANHTFAENIVDFVPKNAVIQDGHLVLCLTKKSAPGLVGTFPKDTLPIPPDTYKVPTTKLVAKAIKAPLVRWNNGELTLANSATIGIQRVEILDIQGRLVGHQAMPIAREQVSMALPHLQAGLYFTRIQDARGLYTQASFMVN